MRKYYSLYGRLLEKQRLYDAFKHVKRAKGAAGVDGQSLSAFAENLDAELSQLLFELKEKRHQPQQVKRVVIAKAGVMTVAGWWIWICPNVSILILCGSESGAKHARSVATTYLEETLKLTVNTKKTHIAHSDVGVKFLGVEIHTGYTRIQEQKVKAFKAKVKQITRRNAGSNLAGVIRELNPVLRGFVSYFRIANCKGVMKTLMSWIRHRLRAIQMKQWKKPSRLHRRLRQLGYKPPFKWIKMRSWRNAASPLAHYAVGCMMNRG